MDWDDDYDNGYDGTDYASHRDNSIPDTGNSDGGLDFKDIANPVSAYFFLSDDAQDEISGGKKKNMKCLDCGHTFVGEIYERCPECFSSNTEKTTDEKDHGYW